MLNEIETEQLRAMLDAYGLPGVIDAIISEASSRYVADPDRCDAWVYDAGLLRKLLPRLWTGGAAKRRRFGG